ncbi:MAG TPA: ATP-binding protein, partial [Polyangiaceae bacterium]|nr:ATP-binding protein [Polyangiaceae bacterium]
LDELLADTMPRETRQLLTMMRRNVLRLKKLVNTLLEFSRIEAGRVEACFEPTDLSKYTAELASTFRSACERAGVALEVDCPTLPAPVYVDIEMWEKIVLNLMSNAFKFTLDGKISVTLAATDEFVELRVADTGVGIPEDELPRLFQRFHRVEGIMGRTQEGSGIGLALVHELVRLHGGRVGVESVRRKGTTFSVRIPLGTAHLPADRLAGSPTSEPPSIGAAPFVEEALRWIPDAQSAPPASEEPGPEVRTATGYRPHILLADDNADMRDYLRRLLSPEYRVTAVPDGQAALERLRQLKPDLVLSDVMMPRLDGFSLLNAVRNDPSVCDLPVILLSARAGEEARVEGLEAGADDYLTKPFSANELLARITSHLALARLRRESAATLRESEARFRNMADNAPVMIWVTDVDGQCIYLNDQWYAFTGTSPEHALGTGWLQSVHPEDREATDAAFEAAYVRRTSCRLEYRLRRADGEYRWAIDSAAPRFGDGEFLGHIGSVIDVTDLKNIEAQLRDADRRKDEFLATLAHELRNPLAPIRTGLEIMRLAGDDPATTARIRTTLERQTQQIMRLIDDLLDVSRITQGKLELRKNHADLNEIIDSALEATRPLVIESGHQLEVQRPPTPITVHADPYRMAQILSNLLNNAAKYTPSGGHIWLSVTVEGEQLRLSVKDTGLGIEPGQQEHIFQMFTQLNRTHQRGTAGVGIGLTLVRSLVQLHGGSIEVHSDGQGMGSEFRVLLPVVTGARTMPEEPDSAPPPPSRTRRVLVVDDNRDAADMLGAALELMGNEVFTAYDGKSALGLAAQHRPEVVLLDLGMPEVDGYEIARRLRSEPWGSQLKLVALTGWGQLGDRQRSREAGFDQHLVKPVEPDLLRKTLDELPEISIATNR